MTENMLLTCYTHLKQAKIECYPDFIEVVDVMARLKLHAVRVDG